MKKKITAFVILFCIAATAIFSQSLAINTDGSTANASALLDVKSTAKGMLIPRMSRTERNAIASPVTGLLIFQNAPDSIGFYYYNGSSWTWVLANSNADSLAWRTVGNTGTVDVNNFIGTKDNIPFNIRVNNQKAGRIDHINWNTFYGYQAGNANTSGIHNTAIGHQALISNLSGTNNVAIGTLALNSSTTGDQNTAMGYGAMYDNTVGTFNTAYGFYALYQNKAGSNATAIGVQSMLYANNTTTPFTNNNVAVGYESLKGNAPASGNTGLNNTALGYQTMWNNSSGLSNSATGFSALLTNTTGNNNTANGYRALYSNTTADDNTALGTDALFSNTTGAFNTAAGFYALRNNTTGIHNTALGLTALYLNTTAGRNTAIGNNTLYTQSFNNGGTAWNSFNVAVGDSALFYNQPTATTNGYYNTAIGNQAMRTNTTGYQNTATGSVALYSNTTGQLNSADGWASLFKNSTGQYNAASGAMAMYYNTSGNYNVGMGTQALHNNVTGSNNTVIGKDAGLGVLNNSYSNNTILGYQSGYGLTTGSNNVFLGYQAGYAETTGSNKLYIANSSSNPPLIYGDFSTGRVGIATITPNEKLEVNGNMLLTGTGTIYTGAGITNMTIHSGDGTGSGGAMTIRGGNAGVGSGGAGGNITIQGGANLPSGGAGYGGLGAPGIVNIIGSYGYNSVGGAINITAGATSCWSLVSGSHSDVNISGGQNLATTDASSIVLEGGYTIGTSCPPPGATGGNLVLKSGLGSGTGTTGNIQLLNGNVGIGCTAPAYKLHVIGDIASSGTVRSTNVVVVGAITACSDVRYKTNISPIKNSLKNLMQLQGVNYYWKTSEYGNMNFTDKLQIGFIAQDLEKVFPEMVFTDEKGYKSIDYSRLTPVLVETIKEQQKQITAISNRLNEIEKMLNK